LQPRDYLQRKKNGEKWGEMDMGRNMGEKDRWGRWGEVSTFDLKQLFYHSIGAGAFSHFDSGILENPDLENSREFHS